MRKGFLTACMAIFFALFIGCGGSPPLEEETVSYCAKLESKSTCTAFECKFYPFNIQFDRLQHVSAYPAVKNPAGVFEPVCSGQATGVILNLNLLSTQLSDNKDRDLSIRPGDALNGFQLEERFVVKEGENIDSNLFDLYMDCIEPYPDPDLLGERNCQGLEEPEGVVVESLGYFSDMKPDAEGCYPRPLEENKFGVAILVDQSGSIKGRVHKTTYKEVAPDDPNEENLLFKDYASDITNYRLSAIKDLIHDLNENDKLIMFAYGETYGQSPKTVCNIPGDPDATEQKKRDSCFGVNRSLILGDKTTGLASAIDSIRYEARGRTPLYQALSEAWDFMSKQTVEYKHMIVVNDGPDTCHPESENFVASGNNAPCSSVGYQELVQKIKGNPGARIRISFIQFQAKGYGKIDATQQELSCMTGGHYIFINSEDFAKAGQALYDTLKESVMKVRYSLAGIWRMGISLPDLAKDSIESGKIHSLKGALTIGPSEFTALSKSTYLSAGEDNAPYLGNWDKRAVIRKPCQDAVVCEPPANECLESICQGHSLLCAESPISDNSACSGGICCSGACVAGSAVCRCDRYPIKHQ